MTIACHIELKEIDKYLEEFLPVLKDMPYKLRVMQILLSQLSSFCTSWFFYQYNYTHNEMVDLTNYAYRIEHYSEDLYKELTSEEGRNCLRRRILSAVSLFVKYRERILFQFKQVDEFILLASEMVAYGNKLILDPSLKEYVFDNKDLLDKFHSWLNGISYFFFLYGKEIHNNDHYFSETEDKWGENKKKQTDDE